MQQNVEKLSRSGGSTSYAPTAIDKDKFAKVREGRNRFFKSVGLVAVLGSIMYMLPVQAIRRSHLLAFRHHCRGKVLDLSPKVMDGRTLALYHASKATRVEFLVEKHVSCDKYQANDSLSETEQRERRKAMTLSFMCHNDAELVASSIIFDVVEQSQVRSPQFVKYDTVVIRNELCNLEDATAADVVTVGASLLGETGKMIVMEVGTPRWAWLTKFLKWFHRKTNSSLYLTRPYDEWIPRVGNLEVLDCRRNFVGSCYTIVCKKPSHS